MIKFDQNKSLLGPIIGPKPRSYDPAAAIAGHVDSLDEFVLGLTDLAKEDPEGAYLKARLKIEEELDKVSPKARNKILKRLRRELQSRRTAHRQNIEQQVAELDKKIDRLKATEAAVVDIFAWANNPAPWKMSKPHGTLFHALQHDINSGHGYDFQRYFSGHDRSETGLMMKVDQKIFGEMLEEASIFVVEHDWAAAFSGAQDYVGGEYRLPNDICAFEFRIKDRAVIALAIQTDGRIGMQPLVLASDDHWFIPSHIYWDGPGGWQADPTIENKDAYKGLADLIGQQIKAVCIALDAEVAETETIRADHKLNHARERRGQLPINSYHIISLTRRSRAKPLSRDNTGTEPITHKRLHFRRGHWRHYENHKTWIKWMLVGDPDLGFVDKHYKL